MTGATDNNTHQLESDNVRKQSAAYRQKGEPGCRGMLIEQHELESRLVQGYS